MNLYWVSVGGEYGYFVFSETANRARSMCVHHLTDDEEYIYLSAYLKRKDVGGTEEIVDCEHDKSYQRVVDLGFKFMTEDEVDEMYCTA